MSTHSARRWSVILATVLAIVSGVSFGQEPYVNEYKIGPKDLLEITVIGFTDLNRRYRVSEEGRITLPYLGDVDARGLSRLELEKRLAGLLKEKYLEDPQVSVLIVEFQSQRVYLLGAVMKGGPYELLGQMTLLTLLSQAGGLTPEAGDQILITRQLRGGEKTALKISVVDLMLKGDPSLDIPLQPGDIINIPVERPVLIYVTGRVRTPGALQVRRSNVPSLLRAIAQAGGFDERAAKGSVIIKRTDETGKEIQIKVNVGDIEKGNRKDVPLKEDDIIIVPEKFL